MTDALRPPIAADDPGLAAPPRPAASLVLLRDAPGGLQALLLRRTGDDTVLAGAHVFPGGKLERDDADDDSLSRFDCDPSALHARLGEPALGAREAAALWVAAIREAFEETGVLLSPGADEATALRARALHREGLSFPELLAALGLRLSAVSLEPWSRWITPKVPAMMRRRFDTRFFVARLPEGQSVTHDPREAAAADWLAPREALERYWAGTIDLAAPQIMTLAHLARFPDVGGAMAEAARRPPPTVRPEAIDTPEGRFVCYPGDPDHPERERAMPGPLRMRLAAGRFSPPGGFDDWFA